MTKLGILRNGISVFVGLLLLSSCGSLRNQSSRQLEIEDQNGRYEKKAEKLLKRATENVNIVRKAEGKKPLKFKGRRIVFLKVGKGSPGNVSSLERRLWSGKETDNTIAYAYYDKANKTAYIQPVVKSPAEWVIIHELGHAVLLSNGINGHPNEYSKQFKYW